jgi:hypothetical protein
MVPAPEACTVPELLVMDTPDRLPPETVPELVPTVVLLIVPLRASMAV